MNARHVVDFELAQKLNRADYPLNTEFAWYIPRMSNFPPYLAAIKWLPEGNNANVIPAPLASELDDVLPGGAKVVKEPAGRGYTAYIEPFVPSLSHRTATKNSTYVEADSAVEVRALLWLQCVKRGIK